MSIRCLRCNGWLITEDNGDGAELRMEVEA